MKRILGLTTLIVISLMTLFSAGCTGATTAETAASRADYIELLQKIPDAPETITIWDVKALRADPELAALCGQFYAHKINYLEEEYGLDGQSIEYFVDCGKFKLFKLDYDIEALKERLSPDFYRDTSYDSREVWRAEPAYLPSMPTDSWVLEDGMLIKGLNSNSIDDYLKVADGEEPPMYNTNVADLLARLPQGVIISVSGYLFLDGMTVGGTSIEKAGDENFTITGILLFESAEAADSDEVNEYFGRMEDDFDQGEIEIAKQGLSPYYSDFKVKRSGEVVTNTMQAHVIFLIHRFFYD